MDEKDADDSYLWERRHQLVFKVQMNRHYQLERQRCFELGEGGVKALSLIAGSVAIARVTNADLVQWMVAIIFVGSACSLVFGWGTKARDAAQRAAQWVGLLREITGAGERSFTEEQLDGWCAKANEIETSEPPAITYLLKRAYHATAQTYERKHA